MSDRFEDDKSLKEWANEEPITPGVMTKGEFERFLIKEMENMLKKIKIRPTEEVLSKFEEYFRAYCKSKGYDYNKMDRKIRGREKNLRKNMFSDVIINGGLNNQ